MSIFDFWKPITGPKRRFEPRTTWEVTSTPAVRSIEGIGTTFPIIIIVLLFIFILTSASLACRNKIENIKSM
jgi:hypothetical protein